jgi:hypothetical protein
MASRRKDASGFGLDRPATSEWREIRRPTAVLSEAGARSDADQAAMAWPAPLDEKRFAVDRQVANQVLLTWTISPNGVRNVDKQRLRKPRPQRWYHRKPTLSVSPPC